MAAVDYAAPLRFLETAFQPDDWIAVLLKATDGGRSTQRVGPVSLFVSPRFQAWLRSQNAATFNVYASVNVLVAGQRARTRAVIREIRHVFLDVDHDSAGLLASLAARKDLPRPSYVLHSSPNRCHIFWRAAGFQTDDVEALQRDLADQLKTDRAATPCSQMTRLPGFYNYKYEPPHLVSIEYAPFDLRFTPSDFPRPSARSRCALALRQIPAPPRPPGTLERAREYLAKVPPAITGQHGDTRTFRVCCRLVRGFALSDADALDLLRGWNARCDPPWSERELVDKVRHARRYGREPIGGLLEAPR
jgi:hypothetical protein